MSESRRRLREKLKEPSEVIPSPEYIRRHPEEAEAILKRVRKEEQRIKRELRKAQIKEAETNIRNLGFMTGKLDSAIGSLAEAEEVVPKTEDAVAIAAIISKLRDRKRKSEFLITDWKHQLETLRK